MTATRDVYAGRPPLPVLDARASYIDGRLGTTLGADAIVAKLTGLEFGVERLDDDRLRVSVPPWRATKDISIGGVDVRVPWVHPRTATLRQSAPPPRSAPPPAFARCRTAPRR